MLMMQRTVYQIIEVVAVRHGFVSAVVVGASALGLSAFRRIRVADFQNAFVVMRIVDGVQMPVVQKVRVVAVFYLCMPAIFVMNVRMIFVCRM